MPSVVGVDESTTDAVTCEMTDAVLPEFELDCRDWIVSRPGDSGLPEDDEDDAPVLALLSTMIIDSAASDIREATGSIVIGLLDADDDLSDLHARPVRPGAVAQEVLEHDPEPGTRRYVLPAPSEAHRPRLALLAEFVVPADAHAELDRRVNALMGSFRWHAA